MSAARCKSPGLPGVAAPCPAQARIASISRGESQRRPADRGTQAAARWRHRRSRQHASSTARPSRNSQSVPNRVRVSTIAHTPCDNTALERLAAHPRPLRRRARPHPRRAPARGSPRPATELAGAGDRRPAPAAAARRKAGPATRHSQAKIPGQRDRRGKVQRARGDQEDVHRSALSGAQGGRRSVATVKVKCPRRMGIDRDDMPADRVGSRRQRLQPDLKLGRIALGDLRRCRDRPVVRPRSSPSTLLNAGSRSCVNHRVTPGARSARRCRPPGLRDRERRARAPTGGRATSQRGNQRQIIRWSPLHDRLADAVREQVVEIDVELDEPADAVPEARSSA